MKTIKINFCDFWDNFDVNNNFFRDILSDKYKIEISEDPDYLFCSVFSNSFFNNNNAVRILYTGEYQVPDFNLYDYAIGFDSLEFGDRYIRYPLFLLYGDVRNVNSCRVVNDLDYKERGFCSFVYSNGRADKMRKDLFDALSEYKQVTSGGKYLNNTGKSLESKLEFEKKFKFSIACENYSTPGYTTEKIIESFYAGSVPIYWGDPLIKETFNDKAFINVSDFGSLKDLVEYVIDLDNNPDKYYELIRTPVFIENDYPDRCLRDLQAFLAKIIEQDKEAAFRRNRGYWARDYYVNKFIFNDKTRKENRLKSLIRKLGINR